MRPSLKLYAKQPQRPPKRGRQEIPDVKKLIEVAAARKQRKGQEIPDVKKWMDAEKARKQRKVEFKGETDATH